MQHIEPHIRLVASSVAKYLCFSKYQQSFHFSSHLILFLPPFPRTDLQREPSSSVRPAAPAEDNLRLRTRRAAARVCDEHVSPSDDGSIQLQTSRPSLPAGRVRQLRSPSRPVPSDVLQPAPFKTPAKESAVELGGSSFFKSQKPAAACDVFLQAPFGKRPTDSADPHTFTSAPQPIQTSKRCPPGPGSSPPGPPSLCVRARPLHAETPLPQRPVAVHRVVSRIGQQAAVGSVAVGPLHSWTIGGRPLDDPFARAPFQPRCSQGKP